jgi:hypothetical protein
MKVKQFIVDPDEPNNLNNTSVLVAAHKSKNDILLGRDVMEKIPKVKTIIDVNRHSQLNDQKNNRPIRND